MAATAIPIPNSGEVVASSWGAAVAGAHNGIQSGSVTVTAASGTGSAAVVFPRPYSAPPMVVASVAMGPSFFVAGVGAVTATGFNAVVRDIRDAQAGSGAQTVQWVAIGLP